MLKNLVNLHRESSLAEPLSQRQTGSLFVSSESSKHKTLIILKISVKETVHFGNKKERSMFTEDFEIGIIVFGIRQKLL